MAWYGIVNNATGDLVSLGTEAMFPGGNVANVPSGTVRADFGATRPDLAVQRWNSATRQFEARPAPVLIDRADELRQRLQDAFQADANFMSVYSTLTAARKTTLRNAMDAVLTAQLRQFLGGQRWRQQDEGADL